MAQHVEEGKNPIKNVGQYWEFFLTTKNMIFKFLNKSINNFK